MWISTSSEDVVEVRETLEEQEVKESVQPKVKVTRWLASSTRKPGLEGDWYERDDWIGASGRNLILLVDDGEVEDFSGSWTSPGMIGGRLMGIGHGSGSGSGEGGRTGAGLARMGRRR